LSCVNWTCEGLKRVFALIEVGIDPGVNWTCEGLKRRIYKVYIHTIFTCELNLWGIETGWGVFNFESPKECELNLWGIETEDGDILLIMKLKCELNLWGIETIF